MMSQKIIGCFRRGLDEIQCFKVIACPDESYPLRQPRTPHQFRRLREVPWVRWAKIRNGAWRQRHCLLQLLSVVSLAGLHQSCQVPTLKWAQKEADEELVIGKERVHLHVIGGWGEYPQHIPQVSMSSVSNPWPKNVSPSTVHWTIPTPSLLKCNCLLYCKPITTNKRFQYSEFHIRRNG